jgi:hypothetical protein
MLFLATISWITGGTWGTRTEALVFSWRTPILVVCCLVTRTRGGMRNKALIPGVKSTQLLFADVWMLLWLTPRRSCYPWWEVRFPLTNSFPLRWKCVRFRISYWWRHFLETETFRGRRLKMRLKLLDMVRFWIKIMWRHLLLLRDHRW